MEKAILDHAGRKSLKDRLSSGAMVGLSLCPDKLRPEDAAEIVTEYPEYHLQIVINSDFGSSGEGHFLAPRAVLSMRRLGLAPDVIERITWHNPKRFFDLQNGMTPTITTS